MTDIKNFRWWDEDQAEKRHERVEATVRYLYAKDEDRRMRIERAARLYGPGIQLGMWKPPEGTSQGTLSLNLVRTLTRTAVSNVVDKPAPRPMFATDGGDYELQQRAEGMSKLASGALYQSDFDELFRGHALLAALCGKVPFQVYADDDRPMIEAVAPWQILVDERDGADEKPRNLYKLSWVDREVLQRKFPDQEEAIADAKKGGIDDQWGEDSLSDQVLVMEAWHLPSGAGAGDGRYVCCTDVCDLADEDWDEPTFPFAWLKWDKPVGSFWGAGIADELWPTQYELNLAVSRRREMIWKLANMRVYLMNGTRITPGPISNAVGAVYHVQGQPPVFDQAKASNPDLDAWTDYWWVKGFQQLGISEQAAMAMKPAGLDSGRAQLIHADLTSGRLAAWGKNCQDCYTEVSRQVVRCLRRIAKSKPSLKITYLDPQGQTLEPIKWQDVKLEDDAFIVQCFPISSLSSSASGRIAQLESWRRDGVIDMPTYRRLLNMPDLKSEMDLLNGPRDLIEKILNDMLYKSGRYVAPETYDDLETFRQVATFRLLQARTRGVPRERLQLVRDLIVEIDDLQARKAQAASAAAPPQGMPPGGAPPMPPPVPPMPAAAAA